ncbi:MAG: hypothetical protein ACYTEO_18250 [Planctomycetota bacterium]|jgi:hypothetical protein
MEVKTEKQERQELFAKAKKYKMRIGTATKTEKLRELVEAVERPIKANLPQEETEIEESAEDKYRREYAMKIKVEQEERDKLAKKHGMKPGARRKLSPEEICMKTHPLVRVRISSLEVLPDERNIPNIEFSWGGVRHSFPHGSEQSIPFGLADHLKSGCQLPVYKQVPDKNNPGAWQSKRAGTRPRYNVDPLDYEQWGVALKKVKEMGYVPISERT